MSAAVDLSQRSANARKLDRIVDVQVDALLAVLAANIRFGLDQSIGAEQWQGEVLCETHNYPVTLAQLRDNRLPALAVWRQDAGIVKKTERARLTTFAIRYVLDSTPLDNIGEVWPMLNAVWEIISWTLEGNAMVDLAPPIGDPCPSTDLLVMAGIQEIFEEQARATFDFAVSVAGEAGQAFPVLDVSVPAQHLGTFGGYPFDPSELPDLTELHVQLLNAKPDALGEDQPLVSLVSRIEPELSEGVIGEEEGDC